MPQRSVGERFWAKVDKTETCWLWTGAQQGGGYGRFRVAGRLVLAHRWAYETLVGPVPEGLELDHLCRVRHCVRPSHLEAVTHQANTLRGVSTCAMNARKVRCPRGHLLLGSNLRVTITKGGTQRGCWVCRREQNAAFGRRRSASRTRG